MLLLRWIRYRIVSGLLLTFGISTLFTVIELVLPDTINSQGVYVGVE